jgi:hypothetical protein
MCVVETVRLGPHSPQIILWGNVCRSKLEIGDGNGKWIQYDLDDIHIVGIRDSSSAMMMTLMGWVR